MMLVDIRYEDGGKAVYMRFLVAADDPHSAADLATAEHKRIGHDWSKSRIFKIQPVGSVFGPIHIPNE